MTDFTKFPDAKWRDRYWDIAKSVASWSKDPSRKIGAVAVDTVKKIILSTGYNGFPRGIEDTESRLNDRETKYQFVSHAEANVIYNATYSGVSLNGADLYVYGLPVCNECAKGIIQVGIKRVLILTNAEIPEIWTDSWKKSKTMFDEAGVESLWITDEYA